MREQVRLRKTAPLCATDRARTGIFVSLTVKRKWHLPVVLCLGLFAASLASADDESDIRLLVDQAEGMLRFGLVEKGGSPELAHALDLLDEADGLTASADLTPVARASLSEQIEATRKDVNHLLTRARGRFYGEFPLARLTNPTVFAGKDLSATEELFWRPAEAAVEIAAKKVIDEIIRFQYPHVVFRSEPADRELELFALNMFVQAPRPIAHTRTELMEALSAGQLAAFDRGEISPQIIEALSDAFHAVNVLVVTVRRGVELPDGEIILLEGDFYSPGKASPTDNFLHRGFARDRRDQFLPLILSQLFLFAVAVVYAGSMRWSRVAPWTPVRKILTGAILFGFGFVCMILAVHFLTKIVPNPAATVAGSWWWPALFGPATIIGPGLVAWMLEARLSASMPGPGGDRAVASIFALAAMGACAWFLGPLLLLERSHGFASFVPFVLASTSLAMLFGFAMRTGPPVPSGFIIGPLLLSPLVGIGVFMVSPRLLWILVGVSAALHATATLRHRYAVAHGTEELEPGEEEAARADAEKLKKISDKLKGKLPF